MTDNINVTPVTPQIVVSAAGSRGIQGATGTQGAGGIQGAQGVIGLQGTQGPLVFRVLRESKAHRESKAF